LKPKKPSRTEPKQKTTEPKQSQTKKTEQNWFKPVFVLKNQIETGKFEPVSVWF
jgi:hypothetical protein